MNRKGGEEGSQNVFPADPPANTVKVYIKMHRDIPNKKEHSYSVKTAGCVQSSDEMLIICIKSRHKKGRHWAE